MQQRTKIADKLRSELVVLGGDDIDLTIEKIDRLLSFLKLAPDVRLRDVAFTTGTEANGCASRIAIVASDVPDLLEKLELARRRLASGNSSNSFSHGVYVGTGICPAPGRTVFMFPGEGSQYPDMLRGLTLHFPACRAAFDAADTAVASASADMGLAHKGTFLPSKWIFPSSEAGAGDADSLSSPLAIQSVLAADTALHFLFRQLGVVPDAVMGVGVGEIVALECAGVVPLPEKRNRIWLLGEGFRLISEIASNDKAVPKCTTLSAFGASREALETALVPFAGKAAIAADQTPELFTVCAPPALADDVAKALAAAGATTRTLPSLTKPFHTRFMEPLAGRLLSFYEKIVTDKPRIPVYSCRLGGPLAGDCADIAQAAASQWTNPIHVSKTIERLYDDGYRVFVELGARGGIATCVAATLRHRPHLALAANRGHRPDIVQLHHTLAALVCHGAALDIAQLHAGRNSQMLDLDHPEGESIDKRAKRVLLPRTLPVATDVAIPEGLVAKPKGTAAPAPEATGETTRRTDFPCLDFAEISRFSPDDAIELSLRFSPSDFPYIRDRAFSGGPTSAYAKTARGLMQTPLELLLEIMAESARRLYPEKIVSSVEGLALKGLPSIEGEVFGIRVQARVAPASGAGALPVEVDVFDGESFVSGAPESIASCVVRLSDAYPTPPEPSPLALRSPIRVNWEGDDLYPERLYSGESCRAIRSIPELGENGLRANCVVPPRSGIVRDSSGKRFSVSPVILAAVSDAIAALDSREPASGLFQFLQSCDKIEFFAPQQREWAPFDINLFAGQGKADPRFSTADAEILDEENRPLLKISGMRNRTVRISPEFHRQILNPLSEFLSEEVPKAAMPALPHEVICCRIEDSGPEGEDDELKMRIAAHLSLAPSELEKWNEMTTSGVRRHEWLYGRIAAKDAVRKCLIARYGRKIGAADVRIESDEAGKPSPQGLWRKTCGAQMDISITHTRGGIVAAAAPNASLGIDVEGRHRSISEEFATFAFSPLEQEIAAESGDGETTLFRFWCAKEALAKALGTGLRYGAGDLSARHFDQQTGKVEMEATKLWLNPFPNLRGLRIPVQTCLLGNLILAVCVLNPAMVRTDTGPFIRWS